MAGDEDGGTPVGHQTEESLYQGHAFISYVREDLAAVDKLQNLLEAHGIRVWRDTANLWPGDDWRVKIRQAITRDTLVFIACFSRHFAERQTTFMNEELSLAIEQLRQRNPDDPWLIPVRFDDCPLPDRDLGSGRTLGSIQRADLFGPSGGEGGRRLVAAVQRLLPRPPGSLLAAPTAAPPTTGPSAGKTEHNNGQPDGDPDSPISTSPTKSTKDADGEIPAETLSAAESVHEIAQEINRTRNSDPRAADRILRRCAHSMDIQGFIKLCEQIHPIDAATILVSAVLARASIKRVAEIFEMCASADLSEAILVVLEQHKTNDEKAELLIELRDREDAAASSRWSLNFLRLCLKSVHADDTTMLNGKLSRESQDFLDVFYYHRPSETILEDLLDAQLRIGMNGEISQVVQTIVAYQDEGQLWLDSLLEHIGKNLSPEDLVTLYSSLDKHALRDEVVTERIRQFIPLRGITADLSKVILEWHRSETLRGSIEKLLRDIVVAKMMEDPPTDDDLDDLYRLLSKTSSQGRSREGAECARKLRYVAAKNIDRMPSGAGIGKRLLKTEGHDRIRAARDVAKDLTGRLHAGDAQDQDRLEQYLIFLCELNKKEEIYLARQRIGELPPGSQVNIKAALEVGLKLYKEEYKHYGIDVLERIFDNAQDLDTDKVVAVIEEWVNEYRNVVPDEERKELLHRTVGQWFSISRRGAVARKLGQEGFKSEESAINRPPW